MAGCGASCVFYRVLVRSGSGSGSGSKSKSKKASSSAVCREFVFVVQLQRYRRDQGSAVYFPSAVFNGDDLYDITLTDGDCRLRVTLDPGLNRLVEKNCLRPGTKLCNAAFAASLSTHLPQSSSASGHYESYRLVSLEVRGQVAEDADTLRGQVEQWNALPWFGSFDPEGSLGPLRAARSTFLPLWNNVDYCGQVWRETPPSEEEGRDQQLARGPAVTVSQLREDFLSGRRGAPIHQLIVRIIKKSHLMYYGKADASCDCPYKAMLEVCDHTGSVSAVLWNSVCVNWYRCLKPGDIISLRRYRVKNSYFSNSDDIEISVNSRNPAARIVILPQSSVPAERRLPAATYSFCSSAELQPVADDAVCDVIGLVTFLGRAERIRSKDGIGAELLEYRWLRLEDGESSQPMMVKLFATSQPETHSKIRPLSVVVCTQMKVIRLPDRADGGVYLTNTTYTQVYCTGHHSQMDYQELRPVRHFLHWLRGQDDRLVLSRAVIGGFFIYPPPPVSMRMFMKEKRGQPEFLSGAELKREIEMLQYRERRTFCIQAAVSTVYHCGRQEDMYLLWKEPGDTHPSHHSQPSTSNCPPPSPCCSTSVPRPSTLSSSGSSTASLVTADTHVRPRPLDCGTQKVKKKKLLQTETPRKRQPNVTVQQQQKDNAGTLFEASMEFLQNNKDDDEDDDDEQTSITDPLPPTVQHVAMETLPLYYSHLLREEQSVAVAMGGQVTPQKFDYIYTEYYTLTLRALSDNTLLDTLFLPQSSLLTCLLPHANSWTSILSHGAFSSHAPPPSPADLVCTAHHLANQRLICVLEACHLGGDHTELILSRAFLLGE
ncbi:RPA-related protein RADX [Thalassophryne amazonica]|uniref:RPA-related protein RADX n=1 Tax=Thalassophryne amazonica TaxID=390379 RepID=UPI001470A6BB|nr:RPA-related protein RADX [Thalassophryne amazonica]